ncbi:hypothetical protein CEXT_378591, partial [Caerostris extrusa]
MNLFFIALRYAVTIRYVDNILRYSLNKEEDSRTRIRGIRIRGINSRKIR